MKKIKRIFTVFFALFIIFPCITLAATELSAATQNPIVGDVVYVQLEVNYGKTLNIRDFHTYISYDDTYLELEDILWIKIRNEKGTTKVENGRIYVDKTGANWESGPVLQMKFRVLRQGFTKLEIERNGESYYTNGDIIAQTTAGIGINCMNPSSETLIGSLGVEGYTLQPTFSRTRYNYNLTVPSNVTSVKITASKGDAKQTIKGLGKKELQYGNNKVKVEVIAQDKSSRTYEIMINRIDNRTGDTTLAHLSVSNTDITYDKEKTTYEAIVSKSVDNVLIGGRTTDPNATMTGTGKKKLEIGLNTFVLRVISSGGREANYTINITRSDEELDNDIVSSKLTSLKVNNYILDLSNEKTTFLYGVSKGISSLSIEPTPESKTAKVEIIGNEKLKAGINRITIKVTETNEETTEYYLLVYKEPTNLTNVEDLNSFNLTTNALYSIKKDTSYIIPLSALKTLKSNNTSLTYNVVNAYNGLYYQAILKDNLPNHNINANFIKKSESPLTYETELPEGTEILLYLEEMFPDESNLKVYSYNDGGTYTLVTDGVTVKNGYITFTLTGEKNYVITQSALINETGPFKKLIDSYLGYIIGGIIVLITIMILAHIISKKREEKEKNEPLY